MATFFFKKTFIKRLSFLSPFVISFQLNAQTPFLEIRTYSPPSFGQYSIKSSVDHHLPLSNTADGIFTRFDGTSLYENLIFPECAQGISCYDGHAGVDYHMPENIPILAPAPG